MKIILLGVVAAVALIRVSAPSVASATTYDLTALGSPVAGTITVAEGVNDAGQVVGYSQASGSPTGVATIWNGTTPTTLGAFGPSSAAEAINNAGQVVGFSSSSTTGSPF